MSFELNYITRDTTSDIAEMTKRTWTKTKSNFCCLQIV